MPEQSGPQAPPGARRSLDGAFAWLRGLGLRRNTDDRWLAGVCAGIGDRLRIDPLVVRGVLIVLLFLGGIGGLLYLVAWALLPDQHGRVIAEDALHGDGWGIVLLVVIGIAVVSNLADRWWLWFIILPVGLVSWWALASARAGKTPEQMGEEAHRFAERFSGSGPDRPSVDGESAPSPAEAPIGYAAAGNPLPGRGPLGPTPHGMGPGRSGAIASPERVVPQRRPRGGLLALLLTAGLAVAAYGLGSIVATGRGWSGSRELVGLAFALAGGGLALVLVGLAGRRGGLSATLVTLLAVPTVLATTLPTPPSGGFGERRWSAASPPQGGFTLTAGEATLNLAGAAPGSTVHVVMGAGDLKISVPKGTTATVTAGVRLGQVTIHRMGETKLVQAGMDTETQKPQTVGSGPTAVTVDVKVGAGEVTVTEEP